MFNWLKNPRLYGLLTTCALVGCGSNTPTAPSTPSGSPFQQVTFGYIRQSDLDAYLRNVSRTLPDFYFILDEQTALFNDWGDDRLDAYWTQVYANNLILRIRDYSRAITAIRPANPELRQLHDQLQGALGNLESAIGDFITAVNTSDDTFITQANQKIGQFNSSIQVYSLRLSDLAGQPISLFPSQ